MAATSNVITASVSIGNLCNGAVCNYDKLLGQLKGMD